ncbi:hypothetical protein MTO96_028031 [Rhipicephalus appendiculatus]
MTSSTAPHASFCRKYLVKDATGSANLEEIGISLSANENIAVFVGELVVKRPEVAAACSVAARGPDTLTPSDDDGAGTPDTEARLRDWLERKRRDGYRTRQPGRRSPNRFRCLHVERRRRLAKNEKHE